MILPYSEENPNQENQAPKLRSKIIYQIKNKKAVQIVEKGLSDMDKIKQRFC